MGEDREDRQLDGASRQLGADPLFETLFRATAVPPSIASAAPTLTPGTHSRAGNAMSRTRGALLAGAARALTAAGTKITMSQVATCSGVAKATLYNHFRTRDAVLAAVLDHEVATMVERVAHLPLDLALAQSADELSSNTLLRALSRLEPATVAGLARVDLEAPGWQAVSTAVEAALARAGVSGTSIVLRWLASYLLTPGGQRDILEQVQILVAGLPARVQSDVDAANRADLAGGHDCGVGEARSA
jgi:AcrR family transcriptional regulator